MKITSAEVEHVAALARLSLTEREMETMRSHLDAILTYIDTLNALDTSRCDPTFQVIPRTNVLREDRVCPSLPSEDALSNAPDRQEGFFRVPRVIE